MIRSIASKAVTVKKTITTKEVLMEALDGRLGYIISNEGADNATIYFGNNTDGHLLKPGENITDLAISFKFTDSISAESPGTDLVYTKFKE